MRRGRTATLNPSWTASQRRAVVCPTIRSSPDRPTSPINTASALTGISRTDDAIAAAIAKSAAGSPIERPPTTLTNTSWSASLRFSRRVKTAVIKSRRLFRWQPVPETRLLKQFVGIAVSRHPIHFSGLPSAGLLFVGYPTLK